MVLWILLAFLTAGVAAVLLMPFARTAAATPADRAGDVEVYRDQLEELNRDRAQGLIGTQEAEYARAEIGRRLLAAAGAGSVSGTVAAKASRHRVATAIVTLLPPVLGLCLYLSLGNPGLPDQPLQARLANPGNNLALLVTKAERHLAQNPQDGAGWDLLAPIYLRSMRLGDAELAFRNAVRILGPSATRLTGLGETLVAASDGVVTDDARAAFEQAVKLDPDNPRARFYTGLGLEQAGRAPEAKDVFEKIAGESPSDAPWMPLVNEHIAKNGGQVAPKGAAGSDAAQAPGNPSSQDVAAAGQMSQGDRQQMIRGMVDSLAARLKEDPKNLDGWLRLVRSYAVLGNKAKAQEALKSGLTQFPAVGEDGKQLVALAQEMGLAAEGANP
ncbi:c-type cytochrome biogenesis protein CcmI [Neorhizobium lilium]|uniref:C-type cytochrome biogenesis protein CcmI n=1 Tax=Neorhizobium lilium TaxID=2503024 RepID=A0A444LDW8_9HYPH|nr:c-type cytochrome biogenesis protein CcmI [Neorhizobium lilium]RWX75999.1 c-type cytochrome biogenesis protein CcmI [Neorhizobium lilium]